MSLDLSRDKVQGARKVHEVCRVQGAGCRVQSAGCRVQGAHRERAGTFLREEESTPVPASQKGSETYSHTEALTQFPITHRLQGARSTTMR